jgi:alpha-galactosidase
MVPFTNCLFDIRSKTLDYDLLRRLVGQWRQVAGCYLGDFYPLTEYSTTKDSWMAWQFDRPETGDGVIQAFRRDKCIFEVGRLRLRGLDPAAQYEVTDLDVNKPQRLSGRELLEKGVLVTIADQPGAVVIAYKKVDNPVAASGQK